MLFRTLPLASICVHLFFEELHKFALCMHDQRNAILPVVETTQTNGRTKKMGVFSVNFHSGGWKGLPASFLNSGNNEFCAGTTVMFWWHSIKLLQKKHVCVDTVAPLGSEIHNLPWKENLKTTIY